MPGFSYHVVDVFTDRPFGGNPLAVFPDALEIPPTLYQSIARELNLSETTFVLPAADPACHCKVRIFTPARELPTAGHPTIGTAFVLTREGRFDPAASGGVMRMEQEVGTVPIAIETVDGAPGRITMEQAVPRFGPEDPRRAEIAAMLSLEQADLLDGVPIEAASAGVPFLYVPLRSLDAARRAVLRMDLWSSLLADREASSPFLLTTETESPNATVHARMFGPALGVPEDPATGIGSGPLGGFLVRHGMLNGHGSPPNRPPSNGEVVILSEQGIEMGRPSSIEIRIAMDGDTVTGVRVGGHSVYMASGTMHL